MPDHLEDAVNERLTPLDGARSHKPMVATAGNAQAPLESVATLRTMVEMVRRIMRADTTSIASFSLTDKTISLKATSGFGAPQPTIKSEIKNSLDERAFEKAATADEIILIEGIGTRAEFPSSWFPLHTAEGVTDLAVAPLSARGEKLGALLVGYRTSHNFTDEEKTLLESLAEMAALALDNARLLETVSTAKKIWEQTFDAIPDGIIVHDAAMQIVRCNAHAALMMDVQPADVIGLSCADAFTRLFGERAAAYHMGETRSFASSFELQAEDGRRYLIAVAPLEETGKQPGSVITWSDVTELSEMQEQLARSRRLATVGQLAAGVAHEINNPLAAITTCAEATLRDIRRDDEIAKVAESREWDFYLEEIVRQALRCKEITRGLLDLSRQRRPHRTACDINAMVEQAARLAVQRAASDAVTLEVHLDSNVGEVATDPVMVRQVLDNLLSNAFDALSETGGEINVSTIRESERIAIEVGDNGAGIAPELLVRIFDPFFTTKDPGKGSGLGLAISYTLAEALGGALTVETKQGAGSRFRLWLPRRAPDGMKG